MNEIVRWRRDALDELQWMRMVGLSFDESVSPDSVCAVKDEFTVVVLAGPTDEDAVDRTFQELVRLDGSEPRRRIFGHGCVLPRAIDILEVVGDCEFHGLGALASPESSERPGGS